MSPYKQALVLRKDLEVSTGKMISQACHASLEAYRKAGSDSRSSWEDEGSKKVVLEAPGEEFQELAGKARREDIPVYLVSDAGLTEVDPGTETALGIGPAEENKIDRVTGELELVR